jgi:branched-chain amino acid transport system substrate-binding protein
MRTRTKMLATLVAAALSATAFAGPNGIKIGVLTDMSGVYASIGGKGSVAAAQMAIDDFGGKVLGKPILLVSADHQNKADIGAAKAREWFDTQGVDMVAQLRRGHCRAEAGWREAQDRDRERCRFHRIDGQGMHPVFRALRL